MHNRVTGLDTNPTDSHLDKSSNYNVSTIQLEIVALKYIVDSDFISNMSFR